MAYRRIATSKNRDQAWLIFSWIKRNNVQRNVDLNFKKKVTEMYVKISSVEYRPVCSGPNTLKKHAKIKNRKIMVGRMKTCTIITHLFKISLTFFPVVIVILFVYESSQLWSTSSFVSNAINPLFLVTQLQNMTPYWPHEPCYQGWFIKSSYTL